MLDTQKETAKLLHLSLEIIDESVDWRQEKALDNIEMGS
jgi:hypothetical protein